jgi:hypothetical protein
LFFSRVAHLLPLFAATNSREEGSEVKDFDGKAAVLALGSRSGASVHREVDGALTRIVHEEFLPFRTIRHKGFDSGVFRPSLRVHPELVEGLALSPDFSRDRNRSAELTAETCKQRFFFVCRCLFTNSLNS